MYLLAVSAAFACHLNNASLAQHPSLAPSSLTLGAATKAALTNNSTARAGAQQLAQSQARAAQSEAQRRLQITFNSAVSGSDARVIQPPPSHETFGTFTNTITVPLPLGTRPRLAVTQSKEQFAAAQAQYASVRLALIGQVNSAYYDLLRKQALLAVAEDAQTQAQRQLTEAQRRNQAGDVPELDVQRAQVPVASAQAGLYQAQNAVVVARQALNSLIGQPLDSPLVVSEPVTANAVIPYTLDQARTLALASSPDIQAADATVRADEAALQLSRLSREPTFALQASDLRSNDQTSFSRLDTVQASVTVPLSDGGLAQAQVQEAHSALDQARSQAEVARQTALVNVSSAYLTAQSSRQQVAAAKVAQDVAETTYEKTLKGYQNGLFPLSDVLNSQTALSQTRISYTQAVYDAEVAVSTLENAVGKGIQ
ncbi:MAG: TolC family protein [Janthinobacterium lividum]